MIRIYDEKTQHRLYLSPYTDIRFPDNSKKGASVILTSRLFGGRVLLPIMEEAEVDELKTLLRTLETNGATLEALTVMLHQIYPMVEEPEEVIELLMKAGILE